MSESTIAGRTGTGSESERHQEESVRNEMDGVRGEVVIVRRTVSRMIRVMIAALLCAFAGAMSLVASKGASFGGTTGGGQYFDRDNNPINHPPMMVSMTLRVSPSYFYALLLIVIVTLALARSSSNFKEADRIMRRGVAVLVVFTISVIIGVQVWFSALPLVEERGGIRTLNGPFSAVDVVSSWDTSFDMSSGDANSEGSANHEATGDPGLQERILEDGVVTKAEYEEAMEANRQCILGLGAEVTEPRWEDGSMQFTIDTAPRKFNDERDEAAFWDQRLYDCGLLNSDEVESAWMKQSEVVG